MKNYQNVPKLNLNWKDFKNWLEKNIIEYEGLTVKIRPEKQDCYGELSANVLTNFLIV